MCSQDNRGFVKIVSGILVGFGAEEIKLTAFNILNEVYT